MLLNHTSDIEHDNKLFDIVNHLNRGLRLVVQPTEREQIAQLNGLAATDAIQTQSPWCWTGRIVTPSGIVKWIHGESRIKQLSDGSVVWDGLFLDISAPKKAELALQQKSQDLQQALLDLQQAQLQIIQSEKISALGNLVAGIAHEMNNPLGFIAASLLQAKPTFADLIEHLKLYQETFQNKSDQIIKHAREIDLEYSLEDLPIMLESMTIACDRLKNISTSLRTFSRADRNDKVPFNIYQGIDSTILILKLPSRCKITAPVLSFSWRPWRLGGFLIGNFLAERE